MLFRSTACKGRTCNTHNSTASGRNPLLGGTTRDTQGEKEDRRWGVGKDCPVVRSGIGRRGLKMYAGTTVGLGGGAIVGRYEGLEGSGRGSGGERAAKERGHDWEVE